MNVIILCEESQEVCKQFRIKGHKAYSCDLLPCSGGRPEWHIQDDALNVGKKKYWDLRIGFPPCNYLTSSNNNAMTYGCSKYTVEEGQRLRKKAIKFFLQMAKMCDALENPIGIMSTVYRKPDQIIQPWQFGHGETKSTCLWLHGLPLLQPTKIVRGRNQRVWKMPPGSHRSIVRSKTYRGIAKAMAEQWS